MCLHLFGLFFKHRYTHSLLESWSFDRILSFSCIRVVLRLGRRLVNFLPLAPTALKTNQMATTAGHGSLVVSSNRTSTMKSLKYSGFPHVKNPKNACGSPEIGTACGGASTRNIRSVQRGGSIMRLRLGRRFVSLLSA